MKKKRRTLGFTMAEMLIVVAIIAVLAGVTFIAVQSHQRDLALLERDSIAKEIFIAAQNHLTMADSQGYMGMDLTGLPPTSVLRETETGKTVYDLIYSGTNQPMMEVLLPFGSIDETVRAGGRYVIRYQLNPARVLDVFYWTTNGDSQYGTTQFSGSVTYSSEILALGNDSQRGNRKNNNPVIGWFGGEVALTGGDYEIQPPEIEVENAEKLLVRVKDTNTRYIDSEGKKLSALKLIIEGEKSEAKKAYDLIPTGSEYDNVTGWYTIILDDITNDKGHFADIVPDTGAKFIPGEDITVYAVAYSNQTLSNIAYSARITTNSIFGELQEDVNGNGTAVIANFRHLENLDKNVSNLDGNDTNSLLSINDAIQTEDLIWEEDPSVVGSKAFINKIKENDKDLSDDDTVQVYGYDSATALTKDDDNFYYPVKLDYLLRYSGGYHTISNVKADSNQDAGLFGSIGVAGSKVHDLELIDFSITTSSGDAGALVGKLVQNAAFGADDKEPFNISNVVAYHTVGKSDTAKITTASGNAGGLIGQTVGGNCTIQKSAAALIVSATGGNAGGLIGTSAGGEISGCYAGGHTIVSGEAVIYSETAYNVTATATGTGDDTTGGVAGGLIGEAGATKIEYSYSTCSATGTTVGGLIGTGSGAITSSYCTGRVLKAGEDGKPLTGIKAGAFAAEYTGTAKDCGFFEIVNEYIDDTVGYDYLTAIPKLEGSDGTKPGIEAIDKTADTFNTFCGGVWADAEVYNPTLKTYYGEGSGDDRVAKYNLKTVEQLGADIQAEVKDADGNVTTPADFVATHHGDWPAPEIFVVNTK